MSARAESRIAENVRLAFVYAFLLTGTAVVLFPLFWMLSTSLKDPGNIYLDPPQWIPSPMLWSNYADIFVQWPFFMYLRNTVFLTMVNVAGTVISSSLVAYSFARLRWKYRDFFFVMCLATMMLPAQVTLVPTFLMFVKIGWLDSFYPLVVPAFFAQAFNVFLLRQFFKTIPKSLEEAARIDGCGYLRSYRIIILPLAKPALLTVALFTFIGVWNDFMGPLIYISSEGKRTLALALSYFSQTFFAGIHTHHLMAASLIVMLPCILAFVVFQRYFIQGLVFSGLKE